MKRSGLIFSAVVSAVFLSSLVAAQILLQDLGSGLSTFLTNIYITPGNLSVILLGLLLWIIIFSIVSKIGLASKSTGGWTAAAVSLIIVVLSFLYLPKNFVEAIVLQYGAMGATILTVIPFVIILYFSLTTNSVFMARVIWVFYGMYYLCLFVYKLATVSSWMEAIPYLGALVAGIIVFIMLGVMRGWIFKEKIAESSEAANQSAARRRALITAERKNLEAFGGQ
jgi:hypothetical protein